jgi:hypothetical protein
VAGATLLTSPTAPPVSVYGTTYMMINGGSFIYAGAHTSGNFKLTAVAFVTSGSTITSPTTTVGNYSFQLSPPVWAGTQPLASYFATAQTITLSCVSGGVGTATMTYSTSTTGSAPSPVDVTGVSYSEPISVAVGDLGTSRSVTITAIAHETDWKDSAALSDIFHVCGPGKWDSSSWDQATWQ